MNSIISGLIGAVLGAGALYAALGTGLVAAPSPASAPAATATETAEAGAAPDQTPDLAPDQGLAETPAYLIVLGTVHDREAFLSGYAAKLGPLYEAYGGSYIAVGRAPEVFEGTGDFESYVISRWPSRAAARAFWNSPEYDVLRRARIDNAWGDFDVYLVDGLPEPVQASPAVQE